MVGAASRSHAQEKLPGLPQPLAHIPISGFAHPNLNGRVATCLLSARETEEKERPLKATEGKLSNKIKLKNPVMKFVVILLRAEHSQAQRECRQQKKGFPGPSFWGMPISTPPTIQ